MALLTIHGREIKIPLIQGGMGVGVSLEKLAGAVAKCGGIGCISTADCGYREDDFMKNPEEANLRALKKEIQKAKEISQGMGLVAINAMVATQQYAQAVKTAVESGVDAVISGAGLPLDLPLHVPEGKALIAPIVSSDRAFKVIAKSWERNYNRFPDFVVLEGPKAGGHLGFKEKELLEGSCQPVTEILKKLVEAVKPYEEAVGRKIPVFAAGGIWDKADIEEAQDLGAAGVQMATRFIGTEECDASQGYKDTLINADHEDVRIIHSPVGMPGRALATPLIKKLDSFGRIPPTHCSRCIKTCNPKEVPYCITKALIEAVQGNYEEGLFFTGANVGRLTEMTTVPELVKKLGF